MLKLISAKFLLPMISRNELYNYLLYDPTHHASHQPLSQASTL